MSVSGSSFSVGSTLMSLAAYMLKGTWGKPVRHGENLSYHIVLKFLKHQTVIHQHLPFRLFCRLVEGCSIFENCKRCNNGTWGLRDDFFIKGKYCAECRPGWSGGDCLSKFFTNLYLTLCHAFIPTQHTDEIFRKTFPDCILIPTNYITGKYK